MTPLPPPLGDGALVAWRLDDARHAGEWDHGEGAFRVGGRWNGRGRRTVYCSLDPAAAILEVAVHKGFAALGRVAHVLTSLSILDPLDVHVVPPKAVPEAAWLAPGIPAAGQQAFGDDLLAAHRFVLIPSVVSRHSWNLLFERARADGRYRLLTQEPFALDGRLRSEAR